MRLPQNPCVSVMVLSNLFYASVKMIGSFLVTMVNYVVCFFLTPGINCIPGIDPT